LSYEQTSTSRAATAKQQLEAEIWCDRISDNHHSRFEREFHCRDRLPTRRRKSLRRLSQTIVEVIKRPLLPGRGLSYPESHHALSFSILSSRSSFYRPCMGSRLFESCRDEPQGQQAPSALFYRFRLVWTFYEDE